jgi:hypothetical protein
MTSSSFAMATTLPNVSASTASASPLTSSPDTMNLTGTGKIVRLSRAIHSLPLPKPAKPGN